ncbi:MAG: hypothetical protein Q4G43_01735 [Mobilicoccus sp.]|nr:hypothetical protein [Mobilicoccus sp.]
MTMLVGASVLLVVLVTVLAGSRTAGADPRGLCGELARDYAVDLPVGWTLECSPGFPQSWPADHATLALSHRPSRRIVVRDGQDPTATSAAIAHEIAHAEATQWQPEVRAAFARAVGQERWSGDGPDAPVEVFAESSVRCRGLPIDPTHPLVHCELVEAARTAGGQSTPLRAVDQKIR